VQTNTSLLLKETNSCLNLCWNQWLRVTLKIFMIFPNFIQKLQMTLIFMVMMRCLMSLLVGVKIYFVSKFSWIFQIFHISNSWLVFINVVSKSSCFHVTKMITFVIQNSLVHINPLGAPNRLWCLGCSTLWVLHGGLYHFLHKMTFFEVLPKVHDY
jgi:hypothetical protein